MANLIAVHLLCAASGYLLASRSIGLRAVGIVLLFLTGVWWGCMLILGWTP